MIRLQPELQLLNVAEWIFSRPRNFQSIKNEGANVKRKFQES